MLRLCFNSPIIACIVIGSSAIVSQDMGSCVSGGSFKVLSARAHLLCVRCVVVQCVSGHWLLACAKLRVIVLLSAGVQLLFQCKAVCYGVGRGCNS